jgi:Calcineurin-like phosphoesterase/Omp85 superfamily domain
MLKKITFILGWCIVPLLALSQETVKYRVILIGDAGEMNSKQLESLKDAAKHVIKDKTTTLYLGDNIYPTGMALKGDKNIKETEQILRSQFEPMRANGAAVYFVPGNHDWDKSGPDGLAKIQRQSEFLASYNDPLLKLVPENGCPYPVAINLTDKLTVIAYDSEWWLFPYAKFNPDCECNSKEQITLRMRELLDQNKDKIIILASHHPFQSYGVHGGYFTFKNHVFPLTALNKNLYIPLPVIGSLYPLLRTTFLSPEDMKHPLYKEMMAKVNVVFGDLPNVVYVAGHEHGLQFIKGKQLQIVSGAGAKHSPNKKGKNSLFHSGENGYVIADQLLNNDMRYEYFVHTDTGVVRVFSYTQPYKELIFATKKEIQPIIGDSVMVKVKPAFDSVGSFHRYLFGNNYRKDYATDTRLPVIRISEIKGGLLPTQLGGGNQSRSLRLKDKNGNEYVLRSVEKYPEVLLPQGLRTTFAKDVLQDNMASQHPFGALVVPVLAKAAGIPHANPIIGLVSPDKNLGDYASLFENTICLLEERNPIGDSDNTTKMLKKLDKDNDNTYDAKMYLRARALDVLIGDWDRHEDQWRWKADSTKKGLKYLPVPRDRDQVFFSADGKLQRFAQKSDLLPMMQGMEKDLKDINWFLWEGRAMNSKILSQYTEAEWDRQIKEFCDIYTDEVFEEALKNLPKESYALRHDQFLRQLKQRKATLPKIMNEYYHFFNRIVDIQASHKNEKAVITDSAGKHLKVELYKIAKSGNVKDVIFSRNFDPKVTKSIRLYMRDGNDSIFIDNKTSPIRLKIIAGQGKKVYDIKASNQSIRLFGLKDENIFDGDDRNKLRVKLSADTGNATYLGKDLYSRTSLYPNVGYNVDDGVSLGAFMKITNPGFRKQPYGNAQSLSLLYAFSTSAVRFNYTGDWLKAIGNADVVVKASVQAPDNTRNFFGVGNETKFDDRISYYRTRFNLIQLEPTLRWRRPKSTISIGPSFQFYTFDKKDNIDRFINNIDELHSPDSLVVGHEKFYVGAVVNFINNTRDNDLLPTLGSYIDFRLVGYKGVNSTAQSFMQFNGSIALYKNLDGRANLILANRFGGSITVGKPAFYQHAYLGGEGNLLGYRQYRFAGLHSFYNNLELRAKLGDFVSYVLPGQVGLLGLYDVGRVWRKDEGSDQWHHGVGGGVYFAPASLTIFRAVMAYSKEGWYPYFSMNFRF